MKNTKFYIISILFIFILIEIFSILVLDIIKKSSTLSNFLKASHTAKEIEKYSEFIPYSRNKINFNELNNYIIKEDENYFFSTIKPFNKKNKENILIQGDSWAEIAQQKEINEFLKEYSQSNKVGLINAGISSYSPSPMTSQLFILKKEFNISPTILITIIDQTDIGDEIYRYMSLDKKSFSPTLTSLHVNFYKKISDNFEKTNLSFFKLIQFAKSYFFLHKEIYGLKNLNTLKIISKKIKAKIFGVNLVLSPLRFGINEFEKNIIKKRINNYINIALDNNSLKKIYFVTHPHLNHLKVSGGKYILDVSDLIDEIILSSPHTSVLEHINFSKLNKSIDPSIFKKGDNFSHLTNKAYRDYYYPAILEEIKF